MCGQIEVRDCVEVLKESVDNGVKYDYVINDLTEFSVEKSKYGVCMNCGISVSVCLSVCLPVCLNVQEDLSVLVVYISGYVLSAVLLLASVAIFCYFRSVLSTPEPSSATSGQCCPLPDPSTTG